MVAPAAGPQHLGTLVSSVSRVLGIDEAGRGAVLGPLVVAGVLAPGDRRPALRAHGARDSKTVPRHRRRSVLRTLLQETEACWAVVIPPEEIDAGNLTTLEEEAITALITRLAPNEAILDAPVGPSALPRFLRRLRTTLDGRTELTAYPKADRSDPIVGAASLLAKVVRDGYIDALRPRYGDIGWGYPGEMRVRRFLEGWVATHGALPPICRTRWASNRTLAFPPLPLTER